MVKEPTVVDEIGMVTYGDHHPKIYKFTNVAGIKSIKDVKINGWFIIVSLYIY